MQLKALEMIGFKSSSDKTVIAFQPGITAVVGPNGCGKSNISDAIRWVLGEQSAKHLRGDKMEDVIFNGSEYFINKIPCRLKDIRDLMMDAGVGSRIHAIIEQDKVDQILSSKPQDRRFLFEEVA